MRREKKIEMSKKNETVTTEPRVPGITWQLSGDARRPSEAPWGFVIRNPLVITLPPKTHTDVRLHVAPSTAVLCFAPRSCASYVTVPQLVNAGVDLVVRVENPSEHMPLTIETGEPLVNAFPLVYDHGHRRSEEG